jgi:AmmeMemoRadiSam system protein A
MDFTLTHNEQRLLLDLARKTLEQRLKRTQAEAVNPDDLPESLRIHCGAFVTLHERGRLRGCIGHLLGDMPLYRMVEDMAVSSALHDPRFYPITADELNNVIIEISVLSPMRLIERIDEIRLGTHGILIRHGSRSGVFLPQVATETGWSLEDLLGHCSRDKAGLGWNGWKEAEIYVFTATVFSEND